MIPHITNAKRPYRATNNKAMDPIAHHHLPVHKAGFLQIDVFAGVPPQTCA